jgi:hypothetical protein
MLTITIASHWVGLTFPGMIEEPGSFSGSSNSPRPQRRPEATLKDAALQSGNIDERRFDEIVDPTKMVGHGVAGS